jgi:hypothetical protein
VATQGRAIWIIDDLSPLHQITPQIAANAAHLYQPRDGYRTRTSPELLGPMVEYYLPEAPAGEVRIEVLDGAGTTVNTYSSNAPPPTGGRGGRGGGGGGGGGDPDDPDVAMMAGRGGRGGGAAVGRVTKNAGLNRFVWDVRHSSGVTMPPGTYQVRLATGTITQTVPLTVLIDPRLALDGTTVADLREQFEHNLRMRAMVGEVNRVAGRVQSTMRRLAGATGAAADTLSKLQPVAAKILTEPVRYGKPGLQAHISYLAGMTANTDQKIGRDAVERYGVLRKELDAVKVEVDRVLGPERTPASGGPSARAPR